MNLSLTASVIGCGVGGRLSLEALAASPLFRLVAAADLRPEVRRSLEQDFPGVQSFGSHREMFAQCPTDVVCVSTYAPSHESIVLEALELPSLRGILVEKPLADTAAAGRRIVDAIKSRNLPMVVPHGLRARATSLEVIARVIRGEIGELRQIEVQCDKWDLLNAGIHWLDYCLAATGEASITSVLAACDTSTRTYRDGMQVETVAVTYVENVNGVRMILQTGDFIRVNTPGKKTVFRLAGTHGMIEFWAWDRGYFILNTEYPAGQHNCSGRVIGFRSSAAPRKLGDANPIGDTRLSITREFLNRARDLRSSIHVVPAPMPGPTAPRLVCSARSVGLATGSAVFRFRRWEGREEVRGEIAARAKGRDGETANGRPEPKNGGARLRNGRWCFQSYL